MGTKIGVIMRKKIKYLEYQCRYYGELMWIERCLFAEWMDINDAVVFGYAFVTYHYVNISDGSLKGRQKRRKRKLKVHMDKKGVYVIYHSRKHYLEEE
jgi:hypothetical protein